METTDCWDRRSTDRPWDREALHSRFIKAAFIGATYDVKSALSGLSDQAVGVFNLDGRAYREGDQGFHAGNVR